MMNELETPLPAQYPKVALFTLWIGAFGAAALVSIFDAGIRGQSLIAPIIRKTLLLGLLGLGAGIALTALIVFMRVRRLPPLFGIAGILLVASFGLAIIGASLSSGLWLDVVIGLTAIVWSMTGYSVLFALALVCAKGLAR